MTKGEVYRTKFEEETLSLYGRFWPGPRRRDPETVAAVSARSCGEVCLQMGDTSFSSSAEAGERDSSSSDLE